MDELALAQERILKWARAESRVRALFWYGSYSIQRAKPDSDLDVALLLSAGATPDWAQLKNVLGDVRLELTQSAASGRLTFFLGETLRRVDVSWSDREEGLAWLADCPEVPEPRLVLAFDRDGAGSTLASRAAARLPLDRVKRASEEIEKFLEGFEAASRAHARSDAYGFYFHYNLALHRLSRLVSIARDGPPRYYLVPQLTNTLLTEAERIAFIALNAPMDLKLGNAAKLRLQEQFLKFVHEMVSGPLKLDLDLVSLESVLTSIRLRDAMYNTRDVGVWLGAPLTPGRLFRASVLSRWQEEPFLSEWLRTRRVGRIIDLRVDKETEGPAYTAQLLEGIDYRRFPVGSQGGRKNAGAERGLQLHYFPVLEKYPSAFVAALRSLDPGAPPVVVHCKAGMDRTGIFVCLVGMLLGVREELILADYVASGVCVSSAWMEEFCAELRTRGGAEAVLRAYGWTSEDTERLRAFFCEQLS